MKGYCKQLCYLLSYMLEVKSNRMKTLDVNCRAHVGQKMVNYNNRGH